MGSSIILICSRFCNSLFFTCAGYWPTAKPAFLGEGTIEFGASVSDGFIYEHHPIS